MLVNAAFRQQVSHHPDRIAIEDSEGFLSYTGLNTMVTEISEVVAHFADLSSDQFLIALPTGRRQVAAMYGILHAGKIYQPIDHGMPEDALQNGIETSGAQLIISTRQDINQLLQRLNATTLAQLHYCILFEDEISVYHIVEGALHKVKTERKPVSWEMVDPAADAYVFQTSGTTGKSKVFTGTQKGLSHFIHWQQKEFKFDHTCRVAQLSQLTFDASFRDILLPLSVGGTLVIPKAEIKQNPILLLYWLIEKQITSFHTVPSFYRILLDEAERHPELKPDHLENIFLSGEPLYPSDVNRWQSVFGEGCQFVNLYGVSELTMIQLFLRIGDPSVYEATRPLPVGRPIDHTAVAIIAEGASCEIGEIGEVYIKTHFGTNGYLRDQASNNRTYVQNPLVSDKKDIVYKTGDYGKFNAQGLLEIVGRTDDQVKVNGIRVNLNEIEACINSLEEVQEAVVLKHEDENHQTSLVCYYTGNQMTVEAMSDRLEKLLSKNSFPSLFQYMEAFPLNINGKVDKRHLPSPKTLLLQTEDYHAPINELESFLESVFKEVLNLPQVSREVSFFQIGGTSLKAFQVISKIYQEHEVQLQLRDVFDHPGIGQLALKIEQSQQNTSAHKIPVLDPDLDNYETSHGQCRLWIVDQSEQSSAKFNIAEAIRIEGPLQVDKLREAFRFLVDRHEVLRTSFLVQDAQMKQKIHKLEEMTLPFQVREFVGDEVDVREMVNAESAVPFELSEPGQVRLTVIPTSRNSWVVCFIIHHIISDGWTVNLLFEELIKKYTTMTGESSYEFPALNIQYKEYSAWHNKLLEDGLQDRSADFWKSQFNSGFETLLLPADTQLEKENQFGGQRIATRIEKSSIRWLENQTPGAELTVFNALTSVISILLSTRSGQRDFLLGMPVACRDHPQLQHLAGFFVNLVPIPVHVNDSLTFMQQTEQQQQSNLEVLEYKYYPFDSLVEDLDIENEVFNVLIQKQEQQNSQFEDYLPEKLKVDVMASEFALSKYDLTFNITEEDDYFELGIEYATSMFRIETIENLIEGFHSLLHAIQEDEKVTVGELRHELTNRHETALEQLSGMTAELSEEF